jgi:hypothetical protein
MHKYQHVAALVHAQVEDGTLRPGAPAPSGATLHRMTGFSELTCRKALRELVKAGVLVPGPSRTARPRVAGFALTSGQLNADAAGRNLSAELGDRRRAFGLTQPALAEFVGVSVTTVGHAETGRLWQSRGFWELVDAALTAGGELLELHDAYRQAVASAPAAGDTANSGLGGTVATVNGDVTASIVDPGGIVQAIRAARITPPRGQKVSAVIVVWTDGSVATLYSPGAVIATSALPVPDELRAIPAKPGADGEPEPFP